MQEQIYSAKKSTSLWRPQTQNQSLGGTLTRITDKKIYDRKQKYKNGILKYIRTKLKKNGNYKEK